MTDHQLPQLGHGLYWQDLFAGQAFRTFSRTLTETDLVNFVSVTGMLEGIFIDSSAAKEGIGGRPVPAALTYTVIEGFILQSMIRGTGIAMLACSQEIILPVRVNDTVHATVEVTGVHPTSKHNRAVVDSMIKVFNQEEDLVLRYTAKRIISGRPPTQ